MRRILMIGDAGCHSGFARVLKGVADYLHQTGRWEVVVRGINYQEDHGIDYDYDVQPITFDANDPTGAASLRDHIDQVQPDVLWAVQDPWNLAGYAFEKPRDLPSVAYVPVDTPGIKWDNALSLAAWDEVVAYTSFGARELTAAMQDAADIIAEGMPRDVYAQLLTLPARQGRKLDIPTTRLALLQDQKYWHVIPHGTNPGKFHAMDKGEARAAFGLEADAFVVGMVCTNMARKRLDIAIRAFAKFAKMVPNAQLVFHCYGKDDTGYDLASLARLYGVADKVAAIHWQKPRLTDEELCTLYNCFDVHLNVSGGEGWGLTSFESAACGVAQIVPDWAASGELWRDCAWLASVNTWSHATDFLNTAHGQVSVRDVALALLSMHKRPETREEYARLAQTRALVSPSWDVVGAAFEQVLESACTPRDAVAISLNDVFAMRRERVQSVIVERDDQWSCDQA